MPPRFLIDENLSPQLARHLRLVHGYDAVHVDEVGLQGARDEDVLAHALAEIRIVVTVRTSAASANDYPVIRDRRGLFSIP